MGTVSCFQLILLFFPISDLSGINVKVLCSFLSRLLRRIPQNFLFELNVKLSSLFSAGSHACSVCCVRRGGSLTGLPLKPNLKTPPPRGKKKKKKKKKKKS